MAANQAGPSVLRVLLVLGAIFVGLAAVGGACLLGNPYFASAMLILYGLMVGLTIYQGWRCYRLATGTVYAQSVVTILFMVLASAIFPRLTDVDRLEAIFTSSKRESMPFDWFAYMALITALGLVESMLKRSNVKALELAAAAHLSAEVKALADRAGEKIEAIARHREQTGATLEEATRAVEAYIASKDSEANLIRKTAWPGA